MSRLTRRDEYGDVLPQFGCTLADAVEKLAYYEDLEEQGRLIELPCKVGDYVYKIHSDNWKESLKGNGYPLKVVMSVFMYKDIPHFGKLVFLTKEEAEAKLAELKGGKA